MKVPEAEALIDETETIFNRFGMDRSRLPHRLGPGPDIRNMPSASASTC